MYTMFRSDHNKPRYQRKHTTRSTCGLYHCCVFLRIDNRRQSVRGLFTSEDSTSLSKLATFCSIIMESMRGGRNHVKPKPKRKKRPKTCKTMKEPPDPKINKNTSRRDRKSNATNKKCDKDNLTGKALLNKKTSNRKTKNQPIKPPQPKNDILSLVTQPPKC